MKHVIWTFGMAACKVKYIWGNINLGNETKNNCVLHTKINCKQVCM